MKAVRLPLGAHPGTRAESVPAALPCESFAGARHAAVELGLADRVVWPLSAVDTLALAGLAAHGIGQLVLELLDPARVGVHATDFRPRRWVRTSASFTSEVDRTRSRRDRQGHVIHRQSTKPAFGHGALEGARRWLPLPILLTALFVIAGMVVALAEQLDVPLRDRNQLLLAAGYAPAYGQRDLGEPEMGPVREALDRVLAGHDP